MEELPNEIILKFKPNQLQEIRKLYDLDKPGRIDEGVDLLVDWLKKQEHFRRKEYPREYLERLIIASKGSVERTKARMDRLCTFRTLWPELFTVSNIHNFASYRSIFNSVMLPELTDDFYRVNLFKVYPKIPLTSNMIPDYARYAIITSEYVIKHDYASGYLIIMDFRDVNLMDLVAIVNPTQMRQMLHLFMEGYGFRMKGIHLLTTSKMSDALVSLLKQILSKKIGGRIHVHMDIESLYEFVPKDILPSEYGGSAPSMDELRDSLFEELGKEEHIEYMNTSHSASTDESKRTKDKFNEDYFSMPGSFRTLSVD